MIERRGRVACTFLNRPALNGVRRGEALSRRVPSVAGRPYLAASVP